MDWKEQLEDRYKQGQWQAYYELSNAIAGIRHNRECYNIMMQFLVMKMGSLAGNSASDISKQMGQFQNFPTRLSKRELELMADFKVIYDKSINDNRDNNGVDS